MFAVIRLLPQILKIIDIVKLIIVAIKKHGREDVVNALKAVLEALENAKSTQERIDAGKRIASQLNGLSNGGNKPGA